MVVTSEALNVIKGYIATAFENPCSPFNGTTVLYKFRREQ